MLGLAAAGAFLMASAKVVGIIDAAGGLIKDEGFYFETRACYDEGNKNSRNSLVLNNMIHNVEINDKIFNLGQMDVTLCAASRLITKNIVDECSRQTS